MPPLLIADFFEKMDKLFFLFRLESVYYQGFIPSLVPNEVGQMHTPFYEKNFSSKNKKQPKTLYLRDFPAEKIFLNFFEIHRKTGENLL